MFGRRPKSGERHADVIVQVPLGGQDVLCTEVSTKRGGGEFLGSGLAVAAAQTDARRFQPLQMVLRKVLNPLSTVESMELLLDKLKKTQSNQDFLSAMSK